MAKELPYFRFTASEWLNDDISLESYELKGLFTDICAYYWFKDCSITKEMLDKRFSNAKAMLIELIKLEILKIDAHDYIVISFLDKQYDLLSKKRIKRQEAGKKGGLQRASNAKAMLKQKSSYKDKDKEKDKYNEKVISLFLDIKKYFDKNNYTDSEYLKCLDVIDKLIRLDNYTEDQIIKTIKNKQDTFYGKNIQSIQALRNKKDGLTKFDKLFNYLKDEIKKADHKITEESICENPEKHPKRLTFN